MEKSFTCRSSMGPTLPALSYLFFLSLLVLLAVRQYFIFAFTSVEFEYATVTKYKETDSDSKIKAYVLSMDNSELENNQRLQRFTEAWEVASDSETLEIKKITTYQSLRGVSIAGFTLQAVAEAIQDDVHIAIFLEDDALPFTHGRPWLLDFYDRVRKWPNESPALFLGGHHIIGLHSDKERVKGIGRVKSVLGAYAYAVRRPHLRRLYSYLENQIGKLDTRVSSLNHDIDWWNGYFSDSSPAYITLPLLVDHMAGYSNTWEKYRVDPWSGKPDWWNIDSTASKHP